MACKCGYRMSGLSAPTKEDLQKFKKEQFLIANANNTVKQEATVGVDAAQARKELGIEEEAFPLWAKIGVGLSIAGLAWYFFYENSGRRR